jgi:bifunctional enzyme CysN/CysC
MPWYEGPTLLRWLETVPAEYREAAQPFALPVQWVNRPNHEFRGFSGRIATGSIKTGDRVRISPSGVSTRVKQIVVWKSAITEATARQSVTLALEDEVDASRGDVIATASHPVEAADQFEADLLWMSEHPLLPGRPYAALIHSKSATVSVTHIKYRLDINTGARLAAKTLGLNEIAAVNVSFDRNVPFAPYNENKRLGAFILIDKLSNETVGAGIIHHPFRITPRRQRSLAGAGSHQRRACADETSTGTVLVVHRAIGFREIDHRQLSRKAVARRRQAHLHSGRR